VTQYRIEELAGAAGTTVRNIRAYRDRGLLPPPRRAGRVALYDDDHLARLRLIAALLERGYTLANIAELIQAGERGAKVADLLGLEAARAEPGADATTATTTAVALRWLLGEHADAVLSAGFELGVLDEDGASGTVHIHHPQLFVAVIELAQAGVPLDDILGLGRKLRGDIDRIAADLVDVVLRHAADPAGGVVRRLRPLAEQVVAAELGHALEERVHGRLTGPVPAGQEAS
jgi:DNA-binding transcriptional MerR regulator